MTQQTVTEQSLSVNAHHSQGLMFIWEEFWTFVSLEISALSIKMGYCWKCSLIPGAVFRTELTETDVVSGYWN